VRLWLFDIDGTLLHAGGAGRAAFEAVMLAQHGVARGCEGLSFGGKTDPALIDEVFVARLGRPATAAERAAFLAAYLPELHARLAGGVQVIDGVIDALERLHGRPGHRLGVATGNIRAGADAKLGAANLVHYFSLGGYGCDSHLRAELVAAAIARGKQLGDVGEVVVIGDTVHDIAAAKANGAVAIGVSTGSDPADKLAAAGADEVWSSLRQIRV
jgi:phosphoglycolate phosphatase-like HAD superfamily hydrolase